MQNREEFREIDSLGEEEEEEYQEIWEEKPPDKPGWDGVPLLQAVICALLIAGFLYCKLTGSEWYDRLAGWYRQEMSQEIQLPRRMEPTPGATATPEPDPTPTPPPTGLESAAAHML